MRTATSVAGSILNGFKISILAVLADRDGKFLRIRFISNYFNPRGPCGPRRTQADNRHTDHRISILAVLADRNERKASITALLTDFNPRGPCGPRPCSRLRKSQSHQEFQSSRSLRTATQGQRNFRQPRRISILAVLADRDDVVRQVGIGPPAFQSSRSLRTATSGKTQAPQTIDHFNPRGPCGPRHGT